MTEIKIMPRLPKIILVRLPGETVFTAMLLTTFISKIVTGTLAS